MSDVVHTGARGGVAIIAIDNPPVNALTSSVRRALFDAVVDADQNPDITAIVLRGNGKTFGAGVEVLAAGQAPSLSALCSRIESCNKPVVAALQGSVLSNAADLALAAHYRLATPTTRIGFTELAVGLIPSGGATQRLPRMIGAGSALDSFMSGYATPASRARAQGLIDQIERGDIAEAAVRFANQLVEGGLGPRRSCDAESGLGDPSAFARSVASRRTEPPKDAREAHHELIACVEGALLLPFSEGLAFEASAFEMLASEDTSKALQHIFHAERGVGRFPDLAQIPPRDVKRVAIIGGAPVAASLAVACLNAGLSVDLAETDEVALEESYVSLGEAFDRAVALGEMSEALADERMDRLRVLCGFSSLAENDLIIDTHTDFGASAENAKALDTVLKAGAIFATLATENVAGVVAAVEPPRRPDVVGLAAPGNGVFELLTDDRTSKAAAATIVAFAARLGALAVRSEVGAGGAGARLAMALHTAADVLVLRGAEPAAVDAALCDWGLVEGPFALRDKMGLQHAPQSLLTRAVMNAGGGRILAAGAPDRLDPLALGEIVRLRTHLVNRPRAVSPETISRACLAAMMNEGATLLSENAVRSPADIDVLAVRGLGLSRRIGGPMKATDLAGLLPVRRSLDRLEEVVPGVFSPAPIIDDLIKNGQHFDGLNAA